MLFENDGESGNPAICGFFAGAWNQAKLATTDIVCECFDTTTAANLQTLIGTILTQAASGSLSAITEIVKEVDAFNATVPAAVTQCLAGSGPQAALAQVLQAYHIAGLTESQIESKVESYAVFHLATLKSDVGQVNSDWQKSQFSAAGSEAGVLVQAIFGGSIVA